MKNRYIHNVHVFNTMEDDMIGNKIVESIRLRVPGKMTYSHEADGVEYFVKIEDFDRYSVVISEMGLKNSSTEKISPKQFENKVRELENKLSYFMEWPKILELDNQNQIAQLRSYPGEKDGDTYKYYEILVNNGKKINFKRIANHKGLKENINMVIPDQILKRLINDFTDTIR